VDKGLGVCKSLGQKNVKWCYVCNSVFGKEKNMLPCYEKNSIIETIEKTDEVVKKKEMEQNNCDPSLCPPDYPRFDQKFKYCYSPYFKSYCYVCDSPLMQDVERCPSTHLVKDRVVNAKKGNQFFSSIFFFKLIKKNCNRFYFLQNFVSFYKVVGVP